MDLSTPRLSDTELADKFVAGLRAKVGVGMSLSPAMISTMAEVYGKDTQVAEFWWTATPDGLYRPSRRRKDEVSTRKPAKEEVK